jgi:hypothetical protein
METWLNQIHSSPLRYVNIYVLPIQNGLRYCFTLAAFHCEEIANTLRGKLLTNCSDMTLTVFCSVAVWFGRRITLRLYLYKP